MGIAVFRLGGREIAEPDEDANLLKGVACLPYSGFQRARSLSMASFDRSAISAASACIKSP